MSDKKRGLSPNGQQSLSGEEPGEAGFGTVASLFVVDEKKIVARGHTKLGFRDCDTDGIADSGASNHFCNDL